MQQRTNLINALDTTADLAATIEAINKLIPLLSTPTLQRRYTHKMLSMIKRYETSCKSLKSSIENYLLIEAELSNKRSLTLRLLLKDL